MPPYAQGKSKLLHPFESDRVFVDIASFNSKYYYVQGDVALPGRYSITGNETVLDAINFAGNLLPTAEPKDMRLIRPSRKGLPPKVFAIDYEAIMEMGDARANLQIFPGDRLVVGRNEVVKKTVELNRLAEPLSMMWNQLLTASQSMRALNSVGMSYQTVPNAGLLLSLVGGRNPDAAKFADPTLTPAQREVILTRWADLWWKATGPKGATLDEKTFREAMIHLFDLPEEAKEKPEEAKEKPAKPPEPPAP